MSRCEDAGSQQTKGDTPVAARRPINKRSTNGESINLGLSGANSGATSAAETRLRSAVERIEQINRDIRQANADKAEIFAELKSLGYDTTIVKTCIKRRQSDRALVQLSDDLTELYERVLAGGLADAEAHARLKRQEARAHGRADAKAGTIEHQHLYPDGVDGAADYELGRQDVFMAKQKDAAGNSIGDPSARP
jgi:uncharacterized protein (UPF0335 family)